MTLFAVLLTIFLDAAIIETDNFSVAGTEARDVSTEACMGIARVAGEFSALTLQQLEGLVRDDKTGQEYAGCRIAGDGADVEIRDNKWPHDILRMHMLADHWQEDISRVADGAGSAAFAMRRDSTLCVLSAIWIIHEPFDSVASKASRYRFEVNCFDTGDAI